MIMTSRQISEQIGVSYTTVKIYLDRPEFARHKQNKNNYENGELIGIEIFKMVNNRRSIKDYKLNLLLENINKVYNVKDIMTLFNISEGYSGVLINKAILKLKIVKKDNASAETKIRQIKYKSKQSA